MKYPFDIVSYVRDKTFSVEARFEKTKDESPLKVFDDTFSRYVFTVIAGGRAATCNMHLDELARIKAMTGILYNKYLEGSFTPVQNTATARPALSKTFHSGNLKGKTPAQVLCERGAEGKKLLNEQYQWLSERLAQYPRNKELMDAIVDASKMSDEELKSAMGSTSQVAGAVKILEIGCRPLIRKKREDGKCFVYEASVTFDASRNYPVCVKILNYYAPVERRENGTVNVIVSGKDRSTEIVNEFNMTALEWVNAVEMMDMSKTAFYNMAFPDAYTAAVNAEVASRQESAKKKEAQNAPVNAQPAPVQPAPAAPAYNAVPVQPGLVQQATLPAGVSPVPDVPAPSGMTWDDFPKIA